MSAPTTSESTQDAARAHGSSLQRLVRAPFYSDEWVTIYNADAREMVEELEPGFALLTDPVYGINGGRGGDARDYGKGDYDESEWSDTEQYVETVCVPIVAALLAKAVRGAVTPGIRCLHLYPRPADMGCLWTPAACTHGPWGFTTMQPILYYGKDYRAGKGALPSGRAVTEASEKNGHPCPKPISAWTWLQFHSIVH